MSPASRTRESTRRGVVQVHEHCPQRPYVELIVPDDVQTVTAASFTTVSRDQGWADSKAQSYTWWEVALRRPEGKRSDLGAIRIQHNRVANPEFFEATTRWDSQHPELRSTIWLQSLRRGDVIQLVSKAVYPGWVNIVREATIKIEYLPASVEDAANLLQPQAPLIPASSYRPLQHMDREIRLLVVKPGRYDEPVHACFAHTSLVGEPPDQQVGFDALSYCWGDSPERVDIVLDTDSMGTIPLSISGTVARAIRRLRSPDAPLRIWIDAICINQTDTGERSQQVSIMGTIYSRARVVHIWLDEGNAALEAALRVVRDISNCHRRVCPGGHKCSCHGTAHTLRAEDFDAMASKEGVSFACLLEIFHHHAYFTPTFGSYAVEAAGGKGNVHLSYFMQSLVQHPWFQRVWVVQEATLSRHRTLVHYGKEVIHWEELLFANKLVTSPHFDGQSPNMRGQLTMPTIWNTLAGAGDQRELPLIGRPLDAEPTVAVRGDGRHKPLTILQVFLAALDMKATDPRDKLFALLPFGQETRVSIPPALQPDYDKPVSHVMADFTRWWICEYHSLDILSFIHCHPARAWQRTLSDSDPRATQPIARPTWAVAPEGYSRWSQMTLLEQFPFFRASADAVPTKALLLLQQQLSPKPDPAAQDRNASNNQPRVLHLRGLKLATILAVGHPPKSMVHPYTGSRRGDDDDETSKNRGADPQPRSARDVELPTVFHHLLDPSGYTGMWSHPGVSNKVDTMGADVRNLIFADHVRAHAAYFPAAAAVDALRPTPRPTAGSATVRKTMGGPSGQRQAPEGHYYERVPQRGELPACIGQCFFVAAAVEGEGDEGGQAETEGNGERGGVWGLCPWTVREGDVVVVLLGGKVPFVLRPVLVPPRAGEERLGCYELVGECFVDGGGVMDGVWMEKRMGERELEAFALV